MLVALDVWSPSFSFSHFLVVPDDWVPGEDYFVDESLKQIVKLSRVLAVMSAARAEQK